MSRAIVELHCQRIPAKPFKVGEPSETSPYYNGRVVLRSEPGESPQQHLELPFAKKELGDVAVWIHHMVRMLSAAGTEFCVRMFQKAPNSSRPAVAMDLDATQVNLIYDSVPKAQLFFAPRYRTRKVNLPSSGQVGQ
jgi:hypothetical protein